MQIEHELDLNRIKRIGLAEAIFCKDKSINQIINICKDLNKKDTTLFTRLSEEKYKGLPPNIKKLINYDLASMTGIYGKSKKVDKTSKVALICAGTSDMSYLLEAKYTLKCAGYKSDIYPDIGVAGLWRLQKYIKKISNYKVCIVAAGMDGALVSVLGGLIPNPIIAIPTSTGYGVSNKGNTALNSMLTSCAPGVTVVNIDNGYGAACAALRIINGN
tara:strand:- start:3489 stop:4139 length:651 start_codon:yes stop_codon:yes gene_type:complete